MRSRAAARAVFSDSLGDPRHGTVNGYSNLLCRCQRCRDAWTAYCLRRRGERGEPPQHGTENGYNNYRCRCRPCTDANTRQSRRRKQLAMQRESA